MSARDTTRAAVARPQKARATDRAPEDTELVSAVRRGEGWAMEALYHRYKRRVFGLVTRIVGTSDNEEVVQEVFVRIYRGLAKFRGDSQLSTWIYRLSVNAALTHVTRRRPRWTDTEDALRHVPAPEPARRDPNLAARLEGALDSLPPGYRAVLVLHDVQGLSHEECANILGCRIGTSKSQLHKARAKMRQILGPDIASERPRRR